METRTIYRTGHGLNALLVTAAALAMAACGPDEAVDVDVAAPDDAREAPEVDRPGDDGQPVADEALDVPTPADADPETAEQGTVTGTTAMMTEGAMEAGAPVIVAQAELEPTEGNEARGTLRFATAAGAVVIDGRITGLAPGPHGLHIHEKGDCSAPDASSAGGHFAPDDDPHGAPDDPAGEHHVGDLGNITASQEGFAVVDVVDAEMTLDDGPKGVIGRAIIVHAGKDDLETQPTGGAGARVACGVITEVPRVDPPDVEEP